MRSQTIYLQVLIVCSYWSPIRIWRGQFICIYSIPIRSQCTRYYF